MHALSPPILTAEPPRRRSATVVPMDDEQVEELLDRAGREPEAVGPALDAYRDRIERMVRMRMDPRVAARTGVSDVVQDAYFEVARRLPDYLAERAERAAGRGAPAQEGGGPMSFFAWVRFIAAQAVTQAHRVHLGTLARDAGREVPIDRGLRAEAGASSMMLASALLAHGVSPSGAAAQQEQRELLAEALDQLSETDREILFLRHFEQLSMGETAQVLGLGRSGASVRHTKALQRLHRALGRCGMTFDPGGSPRGPGEADRP